MEVVALFGEFGLSFLERFGLGGQRGFAFGSGGGDALSDFFGEGFLVFFESLVGGGDFFLSGCESRGAFLKFFVKLMRDLGSHAGKKFRAEGEFVLASGALEGDGSLVRVGHER